MKKNEFIKQLGDSLSGLPYSEIKDILSDYEEHFSAGKEAGRTEEELAASLGDPKVLARQIKANSKIKKAETHFSATNITRAVLATAGLGFFNLVFIIGPYFGIVGILIGLFAVGAGIFASGVVGAMAGLVGSISPHLIEQFGNFGPLPIAGFFLSVALACFGILWLVGCGYLAKWFYFLTVKYLKFNAQIITGVKE